MILHAATIALSAFLLFLVQPIIARQILPWFGGSAAVWTTCMVFFQVVLLAGYFYSDLMIRRATPRTQAIVHTVLLIASLAFLPITASEAMKPVDASQPIGRILLLLSVTIGLPYLMLATTGPLVQAWFTREFSTARVYRLYALSNLASMLALIIYPPAIEPFASGRWQSVGWSIGYAGFAVLAIVAGWRAARAAAAQPIEVRSVSTDEVTAPRPGAVAAPSVSEQLLWLTLASMGSVMLLAITTHITQNVASIPFLWVLPLALYLITFILCFDGDGWYRRSIYRPLAALACVAMTAALSLRFADEGLEIERGLMPILQAVPLYAIGLFVLCMFVHGELVARKPAPAHLTRFYLMVSLGGAIGGLLVGIGAPMSFDWYWELALAMIVVAVLVGGLSRGWMRGAGLVALVACLLLGWDYVNWIRGEMIEVSRNFYGTLRVRALEASDTRAERRQLLHGEILHGEQFTAPQKRRLPTTYYGPDSGIGRVLTARSGAPIKVGLIGVGVGTLATYGRAGDVYRLYELNPSVIDIARKHFTYLADSEAQVQTVLGDARLVLEREAPQRFDVLAVDAFSSDSIPVHLVTREALAVYRRHLAERGAVAFHITNRYLDLSGVVRRLADEAGLQALRVHDQPGDDSPNYRSDWIILSADPELLAALRAQGAKAVEPSPASRATWTDDHHNLFEVLK